MEFIDRKTQYQTLKSGINERIQGVLDHGQFIMGPEVRELEARLASRVGARHCITVSSGTDALLLALMALEIGPGDEVITTPFTFVSTAEVIALLGAVPVFIDVEPDTCNMDSRLLAAAITPRTRAIIPVSLYGQVCDMDEINAIAARKGIPVIEDAAQSFGAVYRGRPSCGLSTIGCTSFFPSKPLGCYGDGGAIFTDDDSLATAMRELRIHGQSRRYYHTRVGIGGRMDTLQCAVVLAKLDHFDFELEQRIRIGADYLTLLRNLKSLAPPVVRPDRSCVWAQFTVQSDDRDVFIATLQAAGVPAAIHYPVPLHKQPAYERISRIEGLLDHAERLAGRVFSLPMHPYLTSDAQASIVAALKGNDAHHA
ncbi:MAG: DegT/DnrJ/EryC1/StrS family aminotransferase [Sulfuritalea sp.]|nr:DegT/DnrJ/EryC1/StrS family aminotransferase [Sulfuritalea sp.]